MTWIIAAATMAAAAVGAIAARIRAAAAAAVGFLHQSSFEQSLNWENTPSFPK